MIFPICLSTAEDALQATWRQETSTRTYQPSACWSSVNWCSLLCSNGVVRHRVANLMQHAFHTVCKLRLNAGRHRSMTTMSMESTLMTKESTAAALSESMFVHRCGWRTCGLSSGYVKYSILRTKVHRVMAGLAFCSGAQDRGGILPGLQKLSYAGKNFEDSQRKLEQCVISLFGS